MQFFLAQVEQGKDTVCDICVSLRLNSRHQQILFKS
jgi:hypothetical protein